MTTFTQVLEVVGSILAGSAARFGLFVLAGLVLLVPALVLGAAINAFHRSRERAVAQPGALAWRRGAYPAPNHTWLAPRGAGELAVGVDDLARRILPSVTAVELPREGMSVHKGDPIAVLRAGGRTVRLGAPVDGTVVRVNGKVRRDPGLVKNEPYGRGWLFALAPADGSYMRFPQDAEAAEWLGGEQARLSRFVEQELGILAADGGDLIVPAPAALGEEGWEKVVFAFMHAV